MSSPEPNSLFRTRLPFNYRGQLETKTARDNARQESADQVWEQVEADRCAAEAHTAQLRAMRLAREKAGS